MIPAETLADLATLGLSRDQADAVSRMLRSVEDATRSEGSAAIEARRKNDRDRKERQRHGKSRDITGTDVTSPPLKMSPHTPLENTPPSSELSLRSSSAAEAADCENPMDEDPKDVLFRDGLRWLAKETGKSENSLRSSIGKMLKLAGGDANASLVLGVLRDAKRERKADPLAWAMGVLMDRSNARAGPSQGGGWAKMLIELEQNKREQRSEGDGIREVVPLLPERKNEGRGTVEDDGGGVSRNAVERLVGNSFRRM